MFHSAEVALKEEAFAKVNLGLWVLGKREDGYHEICSFMHEISLKDELFFWNSKDIEVFVEGENVEGENIVRRALLNLKDVLRVRRGVTVLLRKKVPLKAGLGGGSSDAAAAIKGVLKLWNISVDEELIFKVASELGSDVPFFIRGGFSFCYGRGERVKQLPFSLSEKLSVLLAIPPYGLSTREVYGWLTPPYADPFSVEPFLRAFRELDWQFLRKRLKNDLERVVFERCPDLRMLKERFLEMGAKISLMSGSGSTVFAIFDDVSFNPSDFRDFLERKFKFIVTTFKGGTSC